MGRETRGRRGLKAGRLCILLPASSSAPAGRARARARAVDGGFAAADAEGAERTQQRPPWGESVLRRTPGRDILFLFHGRPSFSAECRSVQSTTKPGRFGDLREVYWRKHQWDEGGESRGLHPMA